MQHTSHITQSTPAVPQWDDARPRRARGGSTPSRLFDEWDALVRRPSAIRRAASWGLTARYPADLDEVLAAVGFGGDPFDSDADARLHHLVTFAAHDDLAARIVLQRILPGLLARARRRGRIEPGGRSKCFDEIVAAAWLVIRTYPVDRRPARVAANLLRDAEYQAFVRERRLRWATAETLCNEGLPEQVSDADPCRLVVDDPRRRLDEVVRRAHDAGVPMRDLELIVTLARGVGPAEIAQREGVTDRAVRMRRSVAIGRVRAAIA
jgi:hypothetical protein